MGWWSSKQSAKFTTFHNGTETISQYLVNKYVYELMILILILHKWSCILQVYSCQSSIFSLKKLIILEVSKSAIILACYTHIRARFFFILPPGTSTSIWFDCVHRCEYSESIQSKLLRQKLGVWMSTQFLEQHFQKTSYLEKLK